jgi:nucleoside-diphosphate-sugar epimerase
MASMSYSNYGMLKQIGERMAKSIGGRVVHFWNVYGYESDFSKFHVVSDFIYNAIKYNQIKMRTNGLESRDFLYVEDCCEALKIVMENQEGFPTDMKIHIASGNFVQIIKLAELIAKELGATIEPGSSGDQVQRDARNAADLSIRDYWTPRTTLESGVKQIIEKMKTQINE